MIDGHFAPLHSSKWSSDALALALAGAGLEIFQWAGARPLWLDEEMIALNLRDRGIADLAGRLWLDQSAPFGWLALQRLSLLLFGAGERSLRLVPTLFGLAALAIAVWVGRRWMRPPGAALFVLLCASGQWISFYVLELKQYSADICFALLLPALAVRATEAPEHGRDETQPARPRRAVVWWVVAAASQWFANGAILVMPACAVVLVVGVWRRHGARAAVQAAIPGLIWVVSFGLHYASTLRYTIGSDTLQGYWSFAMAPASAGIGSTLAWLAAQLTPFAAKPGGATVPVPFWIAVVAGIVLLLRDRFALALVIALIPLSAWTLAAFRVAPLYERLSLWVIPALYFAIASSADEGTTLLRTAWAERRWLTSGLAATTATVGFLVCFDLVVVGFTDLRISRPQSSNHELNDREAIQWLNSQRQPNDGLITTRLSLPAAWWYGGIPISGPNAGGAHPTDAGRVLEVMYLPVGLICGAAPMREALGSHQRALVYFGFRFDDVPKDFDDTVLDALRELGSIVAERRFGRVGRAAIVDLRLPPDKPAARGRQNPSAGGAPHPHSCVHVQSAERW